MENTPKRLRDFEDRMRRFIMHIVRISEGKQRKQGVRTLKGIINANFYPQTQKHKISDIISNKFMLGKLIVKLQNTRDRSHQKESQISCKGTAVTLLEDFSGVTWKANVRTIFKQTKCASMSLPLENNQMLDEGHFSLFLVS